MIQHLSSTLFLIHKHSHCPTTVYEMWFTTVYVQEIVTSAIPAHKHGSAIWENIQPSIDSISSKLESISYYRVRPTGRSGICDQSVSQVIAEKKMPIKCLHLHLYQWNGMLTRLNCTRELAVEAYLWEWELLGLGRESRELKWLGERLRIS